MSAWTCRHTDGKVVQKIVPPRPRIPWWKGPGADSEEKQEPASDIDTALVDSLKVLDPKGPIREADIVCRTGHVRKVPILFSNSGSGCQAFQRYPCRAHCSLRGRVTPSACWRQVTLAVQCCNRGRAFGRSQK